MDYLDNKNDYNTKLDIITRNLMGYLLKDPKYQKIQKEITEKRKAFIKINLKTNISEKEIEKKFVEFLEISLKLRI